MIRTHHREENGIYALKPLLTRKLRRRVVGGARRPHSLHADVLSARETISEE
jgi:hypothetical protein